MVTAGHHDSVASVQQQCLSATDRILLLHMGSDAQHVTRQALESAKSVDEVTAAHEDFMASMHQLCMLAADTPENDTLQMAHYAK